MAVVALLYGIICAASLCGCGTNGAAPPASPSTAAVIEGKPQPPPPYPSLPTGRIVFWNYTYSTPPNQLYTMNADGSNRTQITTGGGAFPDWSPDGQWICYYSRYAAGDAKQSIWVVPATGDGDVSQVKQITNGPSVGKSDFRPVWSPDGTKIAFMRGTTSSNYHICIIAMPDDPSTIPAAEPLESTVPVVELTGDGGGGDPAWSPDSQYIVFGSSGPHLDLGVVAAGGGSPRTIGHSGLHPSWSVDNVLVFGYYDRPYTVPVLPDGTLNGTPTGLTARADRLEANWCGTNWVLCHEEVFPKKGNPTLNMYAAAVPSGTFYPMGSGSDPIWTSVP